MMGNRAYVGRTTKPCETCGTGVTRKNSAFRDHVFCSKRCYFGSKLNSDKMRQTNVAMYGPEGRRESHPCLTCGTNVERPISQFVGKVFCSRSCKASYHVGRPQQALNSSGYRVVYIGKGEPGADQQGKILEHRWVVQQHLGRPLMAEENVHHLNGVRDDNRLENLELWSRSQPSGQRVVDKLQWARQFIEMYADGAVWTGPESLSVSPG